MPAGAVVLVDLAAAGRDPRVHRNPARSDPERSGEPEHLAFSSGIHHCLGAPLARLEAAVPLRVLARRLPGLHRLPGATRRPGATIRGFRTLPVSPRP